MVITAAVMAIIERDETSLSIMYHSQLSGILLAKIEVGGNFTTAMWV